MANFFEQTGKSMPHSAHAAERPSRPRSVLLLVALVALEALALAATTLFLILELIIAPSDSAGSAVLLTVIAAIATIWVVFIILGLLNGRSWTRAAVVVVQVLFIAVALGSLQGSGARLDIALALFVPAVACLVLLFTKASIAFLGTRDDSRTF
jgi:uncharacterized membrane protein